MKSSKPWPGIGAFLGMLLLILDGETAIAGARMGVELCLKTVVPSLFPFLVLSSLLVGTEFRFLQPLGKLCRMPRGAQSLLVPAFLGGYPAGAQSIGTAYRQGRLSKEDAQRMIGYCSNAGPAFLFGMAASLFPRKWMAWALWGIHIAAAVMTARLFPAAGPMKSGTQGAPSKALPSAVKAMGIICGWVILFRVIIAFLDRRVLKFLPGAVHVVLTGMLEMTNGCFELPKVASIPLRFTICSGLLASGGVCVAMQTASVVGGLSMRLYYLEKGVQTLFSLLLCGCLFHGALFLPVTVLACLVLEKGQKRGSIPKPVGV